MEEVPLFDMNDCQSPDPAVRAAFIQNLGSAIRELGFVRLINHGVSQQLVEQTYAVAKKFFLELPEEVKQKYHCNKGGGNRGWAPFGMEHAKNSDAIDLKEFFHIGREVDPTHRYYSTYGDNLFPDEEIPEFRTISLQLFSEYESCAKKILSALAVYCKASEDFFVPIADAGNSIVRVIYYPPIPQDSPFAAQGSIRAAEHEDINLITLLPSATSSGLEIIRRADGNWIPVNDKPGELVVDTGDMFARFTNNYFRATTHRVVNPPLPTATATATTTTEATATATTTALPSCPERMSIPFFCHLNPDAILDPAVGFPAVCNTTEGSAIPEPISAHDFLMQRLRAIGLIK